MTNRYSLALAHTKHIRVLFITLDEDGTLTRLDKTPKKGRVIIENDTDGAYVLNEATVIESGKVKTFDKFVEDIENVPR